MHMTVVAIRISGGVEHDEAAGLARLCCKATSMTWVQTIEYPRRTDRLISIQRGIQGSRLGIRQWAEHMSN